MNKTFTVQQDLLIFYNATVHNTALNNLSPQETSPYWK